MTARLFVLASFGFLISCSQAEKLDTPRASLDKMAKTNQAMVQKRELSRISAEIKKLRSSDLVAIDRPEKRPLPNLITEEILYSEALRAHRAGDIGGQRFYHQELSRRYPQSHLLDNSLLLLGKALQKKGVLTRSLAYYQEIIDRYPRSDKRASAMLFKGMVYRELNLPEVARSSFLQVKKEYPGSPEFFQVDMEMKLLALKEKSS